LLRGVFVATGSGFAGNEAIEKSIHRPELLYSLVKVGSEDGNHLASHSARNFALFWSFGFVVLLDELFAVKRRDRVVCVAVLCCILGCICLWHFIIVLLLVVVIMKRGVSFSMLVPGTGTSTESLKNI